MECQRKFLYGPVGLLIKRSKKWTEVMINARKHAIDRRRMSRKMWSRNSRKFISDSHLVTHQHVSDYLKIVSSLAENWKFFHLFFFRRTFAEIFAAYENYFSQFFSLQKFKDKVLPSLKCNREQNRKDYESSLQINFGFGKTFWEENSLNSMNFHFLWKS
jgi:hypothetical protein